MPYPSTSQVVFHEEALYQVYIPLPLPLVSECCGVYCSEGLGFRAVCEQVSHHPPVSAFHVESPDYTFHGAVEPKLKFWGKSVEITPKGLVTLILHRYLLFCFFGMFLIYHLSSL